MICGVPKMCIYNIYDKNKVYQNTSDMTDIEKDILINRYGFFCEKVK